MAKTSQRLNPAYWEARLSKMGLSMDAGLPPKRKSPNQITRLKPTR